MIDRRVESLKTELAKGPKKTFLGRLAEKIARWVVAFMEGK